MLQPEVVDGLVLDDAFETFIAEAVTRLRQAFAAAYGADRGREATAEAAAYAWEHWDKVRVMANPVGYLYRVGQSRTRSRKQPAVDRSLAVHDSTEFEPGLVAALHDLSEQQRQAVLLVHGYGWSLQEAADLNGVTKSTMQRHLERGVARLRKTMGITDGT